MNEWAFLKIEIKKRLGQGFEQGRCRGPGPGPQEDSVITLCLHLEVEASGRSREMRGPCGGRKGEKCLGVLGYSVLEMIQIMIGRARARQFK
jgi:hypothetical protein